MRWAILALALSCSPPPTPPRPMCRAGLPATPLPLGVEREVFEADVGVPMMCDDRALEAVQVSVLDPSNTPVAAEVTVVSQLLARVRFTPATSGRHFVAVRFEPNLGTVQARAEVARDLRDAAGALVLDAARWATCAHLDVLPSGVPICLPPPTALAGRIVWRSAGGEISRWIADDDGGLTSGISVDAGGNYELLMPTEDDLYVLSGGVLRHVTIADGGLVVGEIDRLAAPTPITAYRDGAAKPTRVGAAERLLGTGPQGVFLWRDTEQRLECLHETVDSMPMPRLAIALVRPNAEWDTAAVLQHAPFNDVVVGWEHGFTFVMYGDVISATSRWVAVKRAGKVVVLRR